VPSGADAPGQRLRTSKLAGEAPVPISPVPRPSSVRRRLRRDREFLRLFRIAARGRALFGDGGQRVSLVFAADLAAAIVACVEGDPPRGVYYPAHRDPTTARTLVLEIGAALATRVRVVPLPRAMVRPLFRLSETAARLTRRTTLVSSDKANEILADAWLCSPTPLEQATNWRATTDLRTGLAETASWYRSNGWL
jgi:nucleoside-diphosphate-sugar epimerase